MINQSNLINSLIWLVEKSINPYIQSYYQPLEVNSTLKLSSPPATSPPATAGRWDGTVLEDALSEVDVAVHVDGLRLGEMAANKKKTRFHHALLIWILNMVFFVTFIWVSYSLIFV